MGFVVLHGAVSLFLLSVAGLWQYLCVLYASRGVVVEVSRVLAGSVGDLSLLPGVARRMLGPMAARSRPHRVVFVVFEGLQGLDLVGPLEVFADANDGLGRAAYELTVAAVEPGQVRTSSGLGVAIGRAHV